MTWLHSLQEHPLQSAAGLMLVLGALYLWKLNRVMKSTPPDFLATTPHAGAAWTEREIRDTYARLERNPIDWSKSLPPRLNRRYIVVGGSGEVGGQIVRHLLQRGQPAESIRNLDFRVPHPADEASRVKWVQTDISSADAVRAAFSREWHPSVAKSAVILFSERCADTYERSSRVNVDGTRNLVEVSKAAGADVFVYTSSASVRLERVRHFGAPWRRWPYGFSQIQDESDFTKPLRPFNGYWGNYGHTKALAERLVCDSNAPTFRTGAIRPGSVYGGSSRGDQLVGMCLRNETVPSWMPNIVQSLVHVGHVSLAHLLFEAALVANGKMPGCAGRPFCVADPQPTMFRDIYRTLETTATTPIKIVYLQPALMLVLAHAVEFADALCRRVGLRVPGQLSLLQPPIFTSSTHAITADAAARKSVSEGGLGYRSVCTSLEGMCQQVLDWNLEHAGVGNGNGKTGGSNGSVGVVNGAKMLGTVPVGVKA